MSRLNKEISELRKFLSEDDIKKIEDSHERLHKEFKV